MERKDASDTYRGKVRIIVTRAIKGFGGWQAIGRSLSDDSHQSESIALRDADDFRKEGFCVIVRPMYNDKNKKGEVIGFHEWRSFNGEEFKFVNFPVSDTDLVELDFDGQELSTSDPDACYIEDFGPKA